VSWGFAGVYRDAACKKPVIQAQHAACTPVSIPATGGEVKVTIFERFRGQRGLAQVLALTVKDRVGTEDPLYLLRDGVCRPQDGGTKRVPPGCANGGLVCRTASGTLSCGGCAKLPNGCDNREGAMAYLEVAP
jgi:hypothetical protein